MNKTQIFCTTMEKVAAIGCLTALALVYDGELLWIAVGSVATMLGLPLMNNKAKA